MLYLIEILHQTTTYQTIWQRELRCILLKFYIKPQLTQPSTKRSRCCILLKFYIKPQPYPAPLFRAHRCILLKFYIKPQLGIGVLAHRFVVSY